MTKFIFLEGPRDKCLGRSGGGGEKWEGGIGIRGGGVGESYPEVGGGNRLAECPP
jgi:hypothetical protein